MIRFLYYTSVPGYFLPNLCLHTFALYAGDWLPILQNLDYGMRIHAILRIMENTNRICSRIFRLIKNHTIDARNLNFPYSPREKVLGGVDIIKYILRRFAILLSISRHITSRNDSERYSPIFIYNFSSRQTLEPPVVMFLLFEMRIYSSSIPVEVRRNSEFTTCRIALMH